MSFARNIRDIRRISQVVNVLARNGLGYIIAELGLKYHLEFVRRFSRYEEPTSLPQRIRKSMEDLGGAYIKLGQLLSLRPDLVPAEYCTEFKKLQDEVSELPFKIVKKVVEKELGKKLTDVFDTFDEHPIGSASVAQVHKASLKSRKMVVVKVQRPNAKKQFSADLDILHYLADLIEKKKLAKYLPAKLIVKEFEHYTKRELDFQIEADTIKKFYDNFNRSTCVKIPKVYEDFSTERVLVMEYIRGKKLTDLKDIKRKELLAKNLIDTATRQVLEMDIFHADLHPGNIIALPDNRLALLDFGIVGSLNPRLRKIGIELLAGILHKDPDMVYHALIQVGSSSDKTNFEELKGEVRDIIQDWHHTDMSEIKITTMLHKLFNACTKHHIKIPSDIVLLAKALVTAEGTCLYLDPEIDFKTEVAPRIEKLLKKHVRRKITLKNIGDDMRKSKNLMFDFSSELVQLVRKLKHGTIKVDVADEDMNRLSISIDKSSNRMSYGMIIAALLISGTLLRDIPFTYRAVPVIPVIFFAAALLMGITLMISIYKEGREKMYQITR